MDSADKPYVVVEFRDRPEVAVVLSTWISVDEDGDMATAWPYKDPRKMLKMKSQQGKEGWTTWKIARVFAECGKFEI